MGVWEFVGRVWRGWGREKTSKGGACLSLQVSRRARVRELFTGGRPRPLCIDGGRRRPGLVPGAPSGEEGGAADERGCLVFT